MTTFRVQTAELDAASRGLAGCAGDVRGACGSLAGCAGAAAAAAGDPGVAGAIEAMWSAWQPALAGLATALGRHASTTGAASHRYTAADDDARHDYPT